MLQQQPPDLPLSLGANALAVQLGLPNLSLLSLSRLGSSLPPNSAFEGFQSQVDMESMDGAASYVVKDGPPGEKGSDAPNLDASDASSVPSCPEEFPWASSGKAKDDRLASWEAERQPSARLASDVHPLFWADPGPSALPRSAFVALEDLSPILLRAALGTPTPGFVQQDASISSLVWIGHVAGLSDVAAKSYAAPFLKTGNQLSRMTEIIKGISVHGRSPAAHACAHSLDTCVNYVQDQIKLLSGAASPGSVVSATPVYALSSRWIGVDCLVEALSTLCDVHMEDHPSTSRLPSFFFDASALLSRIYRLVETQIRSLSPLPVQVACAWILDRVSQDWVNKAEGWLGVREAESEEDWRSWECVGAIWIQGSRDYKFNPAGVPAFVPLKTARLLFDAGVAVRILRAAQPDHPLCSPLKRRICSQWLWDDAEIKSLHQSVASLERDLSKTIAAWRNRPQGGVLSPGLISDVSINASPFPSATPTPRTFLSAGPDFTKPDLPAQLAALVALSSAPPGTASIEAVATPSEKPPDDRDGLESFLQRLFPESATPPRTSLLPTFHGPSLSSTTTSTLLYPLAAHSRLIGRTLLSALFDLGLLSHFEIVRRFILVLDEPLAALLKDELFGRRAPDDPWSRGLGLSPTLRRAWPNVGVKIFSDLNALLQARLYRLQGERERDAERDGRPSTRASDRAWEEGERRISFDIGEMADQRDAADIRACNFIKLVYQPPAYLRALFTKRNEKIHASVQRLIFGVLRVETVVDGLYKNLAGPPGKLAVGTSAPLLSLMRPFRFKASGFVKAVKSYFLEIALSRPWTAFIDQLEELRDELRSTGSRAGEKDDARASRRREGASFHVPKVRDFPSLVACHDQVLDRIAEACFMQAEAASLRSRLLGCLKTILSFGRLVQDIAARLVEEEDACVELQALISAFEGESRALVHELSVKSGGASATRTTWAESLRSDGVDGAGSGGLEQLSELLLRLELSLGGDRDGGSEMQGTRTLGGWNTPESLRI